MMDREREGYDQPQPYPASGFEPQLPRQAYPPSSAYPSYQQYGTQSFVQNNTTVVVGQPTTTSTVIVQVRPSDYLMSSVLACLFCFWPTGLLAIYFAWESRQLADAGDIANAQIMSTRARNLMLLSVLIGVVWISLVIVLTLNSP